MARGLIESVSEEVVNGFVEVTVRVIAADKEEVQQFIDDDAVIEIREVTD